MKFFVHWYFQFILVICFAYQYNCENSTYTTMYDGIDLDEILTNDRLLAGYVNCLLEKGPCTPDGKELKSKIICYYFCYLYCIACTHKLRHEY